MVACYSDVLEAPMVLIVEMGDGGAGESFSPQPHKVMGGVYI